MAIYLIRPGETDYDVQDRLQGTINLPLTENGLLQVDEMIDHVRASGLARIYSSPTEPAHSTARRIADSLDVPLKVLDSLTNMNLGLWQGLCVSEIRSKQPKVFRQWEESPDSVCPPQGEDGDLACKRIAEALRKPLKKGRPFAIVSSEPLASLIECYLRGIEPELSQTFCNGHRSGRCLEIAAPIAAEK